MKEDLGFHGNELVQLQSMYSIGVVFGQIPFVFLFTYIPMYWTIPFMDVMWGVFTLLQYRANSFGEMAAYRFFVGWFEACSQPFNYWSPDLPLFNRPPSFRLFTLYLVSL
jgi:hypothetical protein